MHTSTRTRLAAVAFVGALILGACSGSSSPSDDDDDGAASATTTTEAPAGTDGATQTTLAGTDAPELVTSKEDAKLGSILADSEGATLYTLTADGGAVECTDACLTAWPPLVAPDDATAAAGPEGITFGVGVATDGTRVVTADGLALYRFSGDSAPADANGEGLESFGGTWHVVEVG